MESEQLKQLLKEHVKQQKTTAGISNFLQEIFREAVQEMLKAEMDNHLGYEKHAPEVSEFANSRNGKTTKKVRSRSGEVSIEVPRDRDGSFEPQIVPKRKRVMEEIEDYVLVLYTHGMSTRDIESAIKDLYGVDISEKPMYLILLTVLLSI